MKLQKLTIHNIASIEDAEIDFEKEPLAGSDVFLITGDTGSGKSTILDAICLALYADTPRLDNTKMQGDVSDENNSTIGVGDPRQLLRRNTGEGFVELAFTALNDDKKEIHYTARWEVHRAHDKADGRLQGKKWLLTNEDTGEKFGKDKEIIPEIANAVGLTFDQFCRTTLLAQGEFTRFLDSGDKEKADILKKITGTDIYKKIGRKIYEITADKERLWKDATRDVGQITTLSDDDIAKKKEQITICGNIYEALKNDREKANDKKQWIEKEEEFEKAVTTAKQDLARASEVLATDEFKGKDLLVTQWNSTIEARNWLTEQQKAEAEKTRQQHNLELLKADYLKILAGQAFEEQQRRLAEQKLKDLPQVDDKEGENAQEELTNLRKQRDNAKALQGNIKTAAERINTLDEKKQLRQNALQKLEDIQKKAKEKEQAAENLKQPIDEALQKKNDRENAFNTQKEVNDVLVQLIRQKVHVGDTCPVCHQPIKENLPHEEQLAKLIKDSKDAFEKAKKEYDDLVKEQNKLLAEKKAYEESYKRDKAAYDNDTSVADALRHATEACGVCGINTFDENITPQQLETLNEKNKADIEQLNEKIPSLNEKVTAYINTTKERSRLTGEQEGIKATLTTVKEAVDAILKNRPEWNDLHSEAAAEVQKLSEKANNVRNDVHTAASKLSDATTSADKNRGRLKLFLDEHPEFTPDRLAALNAVRQADITTLTKDVNDARAAISRQTGALQQAKENLENHQKTKPELKEEDTIEQLALLVTEKEAEMIKVNTEKGRIEQDLEIDTKNVEKHGKLLKEKERLEADYNKWNRLNKFIGSATGDDFNKIAQSYILGSLIHSANHYMQNLYDRYTLKVVPGTFVIMIEDAYQGYASRVVSTISGGESFLVSLALALALSDIGERLTVDTLFIDEGFGTLSGTPLQNAIDTLRKLHTQSGRHVGIISHIEELKESIATQIQVTQSPNTGSSHIDITTN